MFIQCNVKKCLLYIERVCVCVYVWRWFIPKSSSSGKLYIQWHIMYTAGRIYDVTVHRERVFSHPWLGGMLIFPSEVNRVENSKRVRPYLLRHCQPRRVIVSVVLCTLFVSSVCLHTIYMYSVLERVAIYTTKHNRSGGAIKSWKKKIITVINAKRIFLLKTVNCSTIIQRKKSKYLYYIRHVLRERL